MERERLDHLIRDPQGVGAQDLSVLKDLVERSPWFTGAHLLRAVGERGAGDVRSDQTLQRTAAHLPSRSVLYDLVERPSHAPQPATERTMRVVVDPADLGIVPIAPAGTLVEQDLPTPASEEALPVLVADLHSDPGPEPTSTEALVELPTEAAEPAVEDDPLERQILEAALASAYDLTLLAPPAPVLPKEGTKAVAVPRPPSEPEGSAMIPNAEVKRPMVTRASGSRLRFTDWLDDAGDTAEEVPKAVVSPLPLGTDETWEYPKATSVTPVPTSGASPAPERTRDLIDRFIQQETPAPTRKSEFFTPQQAAKRSLDDTAGLVTETLARIYEKQGNLPKAIDAYRKLALKYPEKSAYFAALSRSIEEQLNK
jgi:hypothetical protein